MRACFSVLFCFVVLQFSWTQQDSISLSFQNESVYTIIQTVEKQSKYFFIYQDHVINQVPKVSLELKDASIETVLKALKKYGLIGKVVGHQIVLTYSPKLNTVRDSGINIISGRVTTVAGAPLEGVSVTVPGYKIGTLSDSLGFYELRLPSDSILIRFSFIGMQAREIFVSNQKTLNIILKDNIVSIEEVVAIGYGTVKTDENTGAISSVKGIAFDEFPVKSVEEGLRGRMAGVQIVQSSGQPGAGLSVRIRGVSSLAGSNEPLYVIDGYPTLNIDVRELNGLSGINPIEVKSVEVLKDAMATSIYGSRAANGVVLISTKTGTPEEVRITHNSYLSIDRVIKKLPVMNGEEYIDYATRFYSNSNTISESQIEDNLAALQDYGNAETDWQDQVFRAAIHHGHNLSFSKADEKNSFFASLNYTNHNGIVTNTNFKQYGLRLNLKHQFANWLLIEGRSSFSKVIQNGFLAGDGTNTRNNEKSGIGETLLAPSTISVRDDNNDFSSLAAYPFSYEDLENPVAMLDALDRNSMYFYIGGFDAKIKFSTHFFNTSRIGVEYYNRTHDYYLPSTLVQLGAQTAELDKLNRLGLLFEDYFTYQRTIFNSISLEAILGFSAQTENRQSYYLSGTGFPSDDLQNSVIQAASSVSTPETETIETAIASYFTRIHLGYLNKYYLSVSERYDGASVFSDNNKWASFPAVALAWRINKEYFLINSRISNLKVRASWGLTGNQAIQPYQSITVGEIVNTGQGAGTGVNVGLASNLSNENLTWETTEQFNLGIDLGCDNEKFQLVFDYYIHNTKDLLAYVSLPGSAGYTYYLDNIGAVQNKGFEFLFGVNLIDAYNWKLDVDLNLSKNTNIVKSTKDNKDITPFRTDDASRTSTIVRVGEPLYSFYMPKFIGLDEEGKPVYEDLNDDGEIDESDNQVAGSPLPDFVYGLNTRLGYKRFTLTMNWYGVYGVDLHNVTMSMLTEPEPTGNRIKNIEDYYPALSDDFEVYDSDRFIEDASYLRLKNIKLAYTFNPEVNYLREFSFYISAQNYLTFTNYSGYDPEVNSFTDDNQFQGIDYAAFPQAKTLTIGVKLTY